MACARYAGRVASQLVLTVGDPEHPAIRRLIKDQDSSVRQRRTDYIRVFGGCIDKNSISNV